MTLEELVAGAGLPSFPIVFALALVLAIVLGIGGILTPIIIQVLQIADYAYINARVRSMDSRLIKDEKLKEMLAASSLAEVVAALETTEYAPYLREMMGESEEGRSESIERALNRHTADTYKDLSKMLFNTTKTPDLQDFLDLMLRKWDVYNIKRVLRGVQAERSVDELRADIIPMAVGQDRKVLDLSGILEARSVEEVVSGLSGTPYAALNEALPLYDQTKNLTILEAKLDKIFYETLWNNVIIQRIDDNLTFVRLYLSAVIDVLNLKILFRAKRDALPGNIIENYLIKGGELPESKIKNLLEMETVGNMVASLEGTRYYEPLTGILEEYDATGSVLSLEMALDNFLADRANDLYTMQPFGMGPVIGYISKKDTEVRNVRAVARGVEVGLSSDDIRKLMVRVGA